MQTGDRIILTATCDENILPTSTVYTVKWANDECVCFTTADGSRTGITSRNRVALAPQFHSLCGMVYTETRQ